MKNIMENIAYVNYDRRVQIDKDMLIISLWNKYAEYEGRERIYLNNVGFFKKSFKNPYDAAWAVSTGDWRWTDDFVCFNRDGHLSSFNHWDDENSPIDIDRIDVSHLIDGLERCQTKNKKGYVNDIPRAIHEALKE